jgi:hypothetical protein
MGLAVRELREGLIEEFDVRQLAISRQIDYSAFYNDLPGRHTVNGPCVGRDFKSARELRLLDRIDRELAGGNQKEAEDRDVFDALSREEFDPKVLEEFRNLMINRQIRMRAQLLQRRDWVSINRFLPIISKPQTDLHFWMEPARNFETPEGVVKPRRWWRMHSVECVQDPIEGPRMRVLKQLRRLFEALPETFDGANTYKKMQESGELARSYY